MIREKSCGGREQAVCPTRERGTQKKSHEKIHAFCAQITAKSNNTLFTCNLWKM